MLSAAVAPLLVGLAAILAPAQLHGELTAWHPLTLTFEGPAASETDNAPNPFLDIRLQVAFTGPGNQLFNVPGYFDADGAAGVQGNVWRVRFTPNAPGQWQYQASFRQGPEVAISLDPQAGRPVDIPSEQLTGTFEVAKRDPKALGFLKWGRLQYVGQHYLKFADGPYWLRGGVDEPEDLLGYAGFDRTPAKHRFAAHTEDWRDGDPDWNDGAGRALIGALNYLASKQVNSIYFLTMNVGGDGKDVWPWVGPINPKGSPANDNLHYDVRKLRQWEIVFDHAQRLNIFLHFVFNEAEEANKRELDEGELGPERKLFYREMIARFGHHLALEWNLCEEYNLNFDFGPVRTRAFADYIRAVDPYDHPITVHSAGDPVEALAFTFGDPRFSLTSVQLNQRPIHEVTEALRAATRDAGRPLPISLDEFTLDRGQRASHIPVDDADGHRREKIWPTYFSGGMIEFILDDLLRTDSFKTPQRELLWTYLGHARRFMEENLPFWQMEPADDLSQGAATIALGVGKGETIPLSPQVFAKRGEIYAVYFPDASKTGTLDLSLLKGSAQLRWFDPRTGQFVGEPQTLAGGAPRELGPPPREPAADWVALVENSNRNQIVPIDTSGFRDSAHHWRKIRDDKRVIKALPDQAAYDSTQIAEIADNLVLFQRANGGWPKDYDMAAILTPDQRATLVATHDRVDTSFDNDNIHPQVDYLAHAYSQLHDERWREACLRGLDFLLAAQLENGGFPQSHPNHSGYSAHITFNDGVMIGILNVLKYAADAEPHWAWLDAERRQRAAGAVDRGVECILQCQLKTADTLTGWCQQHDESTLAAAPARTFELASICPQETTDIVRFLMRFPSPDERKRQSIDAAAAWLERAKLTGVRVKKVPVASVEFERHRADFDVVVFDDANAPPIWARHYEIGTDRPIFSGRDAVKRYALAEIEHERRTGTPWYGQWPRTLLDEDYPRWRQSLTRASAE